MEPIQNNSRSPLTVPLAIIIAAVVIAGAIVYTSRSASVATTTNQPTTNTSGKITLKPVTSADHILGNPNAIIKIVEFSDPSCPYCKMFHPTMNQVMAQYGAGGKVAWIYRSFPLNKPGTAPDNGTNNGILHKNAGHESQALECAALIGGNDKFWAYTNRLYDITPSVTGTTPNGLDQSQLPVIASYVGLNVSQFNDCLSSGKTSATVESQYLDGLNAGVTGTPYSFIITPSGSLIPIQGAESFSNIKTVLDALINENASSTAQK